MIALLAGCGTTSDSDKVESWRNKVEEGGEPLDAFATDDDIITIGDAICEFASETESSVAVYGGALALQDRYSLTSRQAALVLTASMTTFCPDEADRLNVTD